MSNELDYIKQEALSLPVGGSEQVYCPFCDNGPGWAPSLSITRTDTGILYNCFRAVCSGRGFIGSIPGEFLKAKEKNKEFHPKPFTRQTVAIDKEFYEKYLERYGIRRSEWNFNGALRIKDRAGILLPLYASNGYTFGHTTKYFDGGMKAIHYLTTDTSKISFAQPMKDSTTIILVEDVLSAIRCQRFAQSAALLGTNLTVEMVRDITKLGYKDIIVALDPDAPSKAEKMRQEFGLFFNTFRIKYLTDDPKNLTHNQLKQELEL